MRPVSREKTVLLFYKEYETDKFFKYDRYLKRVVRPLYQLTHHRQKKTGFAVSFELMRRALERSGYEVRVNDYRAARSNPEHPVGVVGFPIILDHWTLPNPAVLGPSLFDHPLQAPHLFRDPRFRRYVVLGQWMYDMFAPVYGERCFRWFAGIDLDEWPDRSSHPKTYDFIVYDKIHWDHDAFEQDMIAPILRALDEKKLTYKVIRYGQYDHGTWRKALDESRALLFLSEHETQGLAYQEAMASGLPVLAWNLGRWVDPTWKKYAATNPPASSVPFFSPACGETFRDMRDFHGALDRFVSRRASYEPRKWVAENLSLEKSARIYADAYFGLTKARRSVESHPGLVPDQG